ncbi:hypothetical protein P9Z84_23735 [Bacillus cereus]|nr:hypothetical protein [Bacillus cereus]
MEFLFELLKEIARAVVREFSAYVLRKQLQKKDSKKPTLRRRKLKRGSKKRYCIITATLTVAVMRRDVDSISSFFSLCSSIKYYTLYILNLQ